MLVELTHIITVSMSRFTHPEIETVTIHKTGFAALEEIAESFPPELIHGQEAAALDWMQQAGRSLHDVFPELGEKLDTIGKHSGKSVLVATVELDSNLIPETPTAYNIPEAATIRRFDIYRGLILGLANWYGYGYASQQNGVVINDIVPLASKRTTQHHSASQYVLGLHTEDASYNFDGTIDQEPNAIDISPDFLTLQYLRNPHKTPTTVSVLNTELLSTRTRDTLSQEVFRNYTNPAQGGSENDSDIAVSILYGPDNQWIRLNSALTKPEDYRGEEREALDELLRHMHSQVIELPLDSGDIAIIDNRRALHGRAAYRPNSLPKYDGSDRWQKRLVAATSEGRIKQFESKPRIVDPKLLLARLALLQAL